jgi:hypothetical protein
LSQVPEQGGWKFTRSRVIGCLDSDRAGKKTAI